MRVTTTGSEDIDGPNWKRFLCHEKTSRHLPLTGQRYKMSRDLKDQLLVVKFLDGKIFAARWGKAAEPGAKWVLNDPATCQLKPVSVDIVLNYLQTASLLAEIDGLKLTEQFRDPDTGIVREVVRDAILLEALQHMQRRTQRELGKWSQVHWCAKAPFKDQYQPNQQPELISEFPVLHMNSTQRAPSALG